MSLKNKCLVQRPPQVHARRILIARIHGSVGDLVCCLDRNQGQPELTRVHNLFILPFLRLEADFQHSTLEAESADKDPKSYGKRHLPSHRRGLIGPLLPRPHRHQHVHLERHLDLLKHHLRALVPIHMDHLASLGRLVVSQHGIRQPLIRLQAPVRRP